MNTVKPGNKKPVFVDTDRTLYVDVDETLVLTKYPAELEEKTVMLEAFPGNKMRVLPHHIHAATIREFKARGHAVIVWSAGGAKWARAVVELMNLQDCVDVIIGKPDWIIDDKPCTIWMGERFFLDPVTGKTVIDTRDGGEKQ
jgi:hypothetical protein